MKLAFSALIGASVLTLHGAVAGIVGIPAALYDAMVLIQGPKAMTRMARPGVRLDTQGRDALAGLVSSSILSGTMIVTGAVISVRLARAPKLSLGMPPDECVSVDLSVSVA